MGAAAHIFFFSIADVKSFFFLTRCVTTPQASLFLMNSFTVIYLGFFDNLLRVVGRILWA